MTRILQVSNKFHILIGLFLMCPILGHSQLPVSSVDLNKYSWQCKRAVLEKIGWTVENTSEKFEIISPEKCEGSSVEKLNLRLKINLEAAHENQIHGALEQAFYSGGTNCAYQSRLSKAASTATQKLKQNLLYIFTPFWAHENDDLRLGTLSKYWQSESCNGRCYIPKNGQVAEAAQAFYTSIFSTDCGVGLELSEITTVQELFGTESFEKNFTQNEMIIGDIKALTTTSNLFRGVKTKSIWSSDGIAYSRAGSQAFIGVTGYIGHVRDPKYFIDDTINGNENFMILQSSTNAAQALLEKGGLLSYDNYLKLIWETSQGLSVEELQAIEQVVVLNLLKKATDITLQNYMPKDSGQIVSQRAYELLKLLKDPFLSETQLYVHPVGKKSISWHLVRLARLNPRTPYNIRFYPDVMHSIVYDRWIKSLLDACQFQK